VTNPIAFYCRAKPQNADAFEIFDEAQRVFIGYPLLRKYPDGTDYLYDPQNLGVCLVNPINDADWDIQIGKHKKTQQFNKNRNFAKCVTKGSIAVIPRPELGAVFLAKVIRNFEIVNDPPWADNYIKLREKAKLNTDDASRRHIADVCQGWQVEKYKKVDLSKLPAWLRRSLFGRTTFGVFKNHPLEEDITAFDCLDDIYVDKPIKPLNWTTEIREVKSRLIENLTANSFEHLIVSLLQLEHPDEIWHQTGGPGDGGIDGLGSDDDGNALGIMQAKFFSEYAPILPLKDDKSLRRYAAVLLPEHPICNEKDTIVLDLNWIAQKVVTHCKNLPLATTMRVGHQSHS
jgi:hypothetical protein